MFESGMFPGCFYLLAMCIFRWLLPNLIRKFLIHPQVVSPVWGAEALHLLLLLHHSRRSLRWVTSECDWKDERSSRVPWLALGVHPGWVPFSRSLAYQREIDLLLLEGALTCVISMFLFFLITDFPEEVKWLSPQEKQWVKTRLYHDVGHSQTEQPVTFKSALNVFKDCEFRGWLTFYPNIWLCEP